MLLRGANYVPSPADAGREERRAPREEDFAFLASLGFNLIRLPISWAALEPRPGAWDYAYLRDGVDPLLRESSDHGMQVVLALHQVRWSSCFPGGSGAPALDLRRRGRRRVDPGPAGASATHSPSCARARAQCGFYREAKAPDGHGAARALHGSLGACSRATTTRTSASSASTS